MPPGGLAARRRRALSAVAVALVAAAAAAVLVHRDMPAWYARLWHPLHYAGAIREEAARNGLDPALVAAVIDVESGFVPDARSPRGALGLMQVLPGTARFVAELPRRPSPSPARLLEPEANIAYGTRYLAYLRARHPDDAWALAAYNAGESNLRRWRRAAERRGRALRVPEDVPFAETRGFVRRVLHEREVYRRAYGERLGAPPAA